MDNKTNKKLMSFLSTEGVTMLMKIVNEGKEEVPIDLLCDTFSEFINLLTELLPENQKKELQKLYTPPEDIEKRFKRELQIIVDLLSNFEKEKHYRVKEHEYTDFYKENIKYEDYLSGFKERLHPKNVLCYFLGRIDDTISYEDSLEMDDENFMVNITDLLECSMLDGEHYLDFINHPYISVEEEKMLTRID